MDRDVKARRHLVVIQIDLSDRNGSEVAIGRLSNEPISVNVQTRNNERERIGIIARGETDPRLFALRNGIVSLQLVESEWNGPRLSHIFQRK